LVGEYCRIQNLVCWDTGYDEQLFKTIAQRLGPFRLGLIPIGIYAPRYFMADSHIDPQDAVKIHQDIRARQSMPIHWGTFQFSHEPILKPPAQLTDELKHLQIPLRGFEPIKITDTLIFNQGAYQPNLRFSNFE
jgi:N-acyl-phosphatidylethanolamine-hydrolysing phospholipase D